MPAAFALMVVALVGTLAVGAAPRSGARARSGATARMAGSCAGQAPHVVFPQSSPFRRSGPGALLWPAASAGPCAGPAAAHRLELAPILADDTLGARRLLASGVTAVKAVAASTDGQVMAAIGRATPPGPALLEGTADGAFLPPRALAGAVGPVVSATGYLGDAAMAWVSAGTTRTRRPGRPSAAITLAMQRHFEHRPVTQGRYAIGAGPVSSLALAMDYRSDVLLTWAQAGRLRARYVPAAGAPGRVQTLGASASAPPLAAVLSDDGRAIVAWISQHRSRDGRPATAYLYLSISAPGVRFSAPRVVERLVEPAGIALPSTALALVRLSTESVTMAWSGLSSTRHFVVRSAPVGLNGPGPATTLSDPRSDSLLGALAPGPRGDALAVWTSPTRASNATVGGRLLIPSFTSDRLGPLLALTGSGPYGDPTAAIDPTSDRAVVAWAARDQLSGIGYTLLAPLVAHSTEVAPNP